VQYAHARIASLIRRAEEQEVRLGSWADARFERLVEDAELDLARGLSEFPEVVQTAATSLAPHRLTHYAEQVAADYHRFYTDWRVITDDEELTTARLWLSVATKYVIGSALRLLGVGAPESMDRIGDDAPVRGPE
jgi:arginyl-tRNA synthetase